MHLEEIPDDGRAVKGIESYVDKFAWKEKKEIKEPTQKKISVNKEKLGPLYLILYRN